MAEPELPDTGSLAGGNGESALDTEPLRSELRRYVVRGLPPRHRFQPGQLQGLFVPASGSRDKELVGYGYVTAVHGEERSLVLAARYASSAHDMALELGKIPTGAPQGKQLGQVTATDPALQINMGTEQDVQVGDLYRVLAPRTGTDWRVPGYEPVGLLHVVSVSARSADVEVEQGEVAEGAFVEYAGHDGNAGPDKPRRILVSPFTGDSTDEPYVALLREALKRDLGAKDADKQANPAAVMLLSPRRAGSLTSPPDAVALGKKQGADLVIWGSLNPVGEEMVVTTYFTFVDKAMQEMLRREWDVRTAFDQTLTGKKDDARARARMLAQYIDGVSRYADLRQRKTGDWARAAYAWEQVRAYGNADERQSAAMLLFYYYEETGDFARAAVMAGELHEAGVLAGNLSLQAHGLYMQALLAEHRRQPSQALALVEQALSLLRSIADDRHVAVLMGKMADIHAGAGALDRALQICEAEELPVYQKLRDARAKAMALSKLASMYARQDQLAKALRIYEKDVVPAFLKVGDRRRMLRAQSSLGMLYMRRNQRGDRAKAKKILSETAAAAEALELAELAAELRALLQAQGL